jgi:hypothetical protein
VPRSVLKLSFVYITVREAVATPALRLAGLNFSLVFIAGVLALFAVTMVAPPIGNPVDEVSRVTRVR